MKGSDFYDLKQGDGGASVMTLRGAWVMDHAAPIRTLLAADNAGIPQIDARSVDKMDLWGAMAVRDLADKSGARVILTERQKKLFEFIAPEEEKNRRARTPGLAGMFEQIGRRAVSGVKTFFGLMAFIGQIAVCFFKNLANPSAFRFHTIVRHIEETGLRALPIVGLLAVLISMVIAYQASMQLEKFGANIFTIDLTVISLLREMGVLITAIMVAGRSGSAFAAEIGVMKLREETDALKTMGMDPIEVLVLPRLIAMMLMLPVLAFLADIIGLAGGAIISMTLLDIPLYQYISRVESVATLTMFMVGLIKAPVFAFIITVVGTYQGMNVTGSAESVGKLTTLSVVQSIFFVIMADAVFSIIFAKVGI